MSVCWPSPVTFTSELDGPACQAPVSSFQCTSATLEVGSEPVIETLTLLADRGGGPGVLFVGFVLSPLTTVSVQSVHRPPASWARWLSTCVPLVLMSTLEPDWMLPSQSTCHCQAATFVPLRLTVRSVFCHAVGAVVVSVAVVSASPVPPQELAKPGVSARARAGMASRASVRRRKGRRVRVRSRAYTLRTSARNAGVLERLAPPGRAEGGERANCLRIELRAGPPGDLPRGLLDRPRFLVRTL